MWRRFILFILVLGLVSANQSILAKEIELEGVEQKSLSKIDQLVFLRSAKNESDHELNFVVERFYKALSNSTLEDASLWVSLWKISNEEQPFWLGMATPKEKQSMQSLVRFVEEDILASNAPCSNFIEKPSAIASLLGPASSRYFLETAAAYLQFVKDLSPEMSDRLAVDRPIYERRCPVWDDIYSLQQLFIVDPTPSEGPDKTSYFVVISRLLMD